MTEPTDWLPGGYARDLILTLANTADEARRNAADEGRPVPEWLDRDDETAAYVVYRQTIEAAHHARLAVALDAACDALEKQGERILKGVAP